MKFIKKSSKKEFTINYKKNRKCNSCENLMTSPFQKIGNISPNPLKKIIKNKKLYKNSD